VDKPAARALAARATSSPDDLALAAADPSPAVRREVAANVATAPDVLVLLAGDRDWRTRATIAARRDAPAAAHRLLIHDRVWQVTYALGDNPLVDIEVWRLICTEGSKNLRAYLAGQPFVPLEIARLLLQAPETEVRETLASQTTHREVLEVLLADPHAGVRADALRNDLVTLADVDKAVQDPSYLVRGLAARHLPIRSVDLERLLQDRSEFVRDEAAGRRASGITIGPDRRLRGLFDRTDLVGVDLDPPPGFSPTQMAHWPATPRKPTMKWFKLFSHYHPASDEIPAFVERLWKVAGQVDRDPAWIAWWETTPYRALNISFGPAGPPGNLPAPDDQVLSWPLHFPAEADIEEVVRAISKDAQEDFFTDWTYEQLSVAVKDIARAVGLPATPPLPSLG
jgi:hypothetical protein